MDNLSVIDDALKALFSPAEEQSPTPEKKPNTMRICAYPVTGGEYIVQYTVSAPEDEIEEIAEVRVSCPTYKAGTHPRIFLMTLCNTIDPIMGVFAHVLEKEGALEHQTFSEGEDFHGRRKYSIHYFTLEYPSL